MLHAEEFVGSLKIACSLLPTQAKVGAANQETVLYILELSRRISRKNTLALLTLVSLRGCKRMKKKRS